MAIAILPYSPSQRARYRIWLALLPLLACSILLVACGGSTGNDSNDDDKDDVPAEKIVVDGHIFNPDFLTAGRDYYAKFSYFNVDGSLKSHHDMFEWDSEDPTYLDDYRYSYDSGGKLISEELEFTYTREGLALYTHVFSTIDYEYNGSDQLIEKSRIIDGYDDDGDGDYDDADFGATYYRISYTYDGNGRLQTEIYDDDADGDLMGSSGDEQITYEYDADGNLIKQTILDGSGITETLEYGYDANDRRTVRRSYPTLQRYTDDEPASITSYEYDTDGNLIREELDHGVYFSSDKTPDGFGDLITTYSYGSEGEPSKKTIEELRITTKQIQEIHYLHEVVDDDNDGTPEYTVTYVFWLDNQVVPVGDDYQPEGLPSWAETAQNNLNNGNSNDGWGANWEGHGSTCSTCGNMLGEVRRLIYGF